MNQMRRKGKEMRLMNKDKKFAQKNKFFFLQQRTKELQVFSIFRAISRAPLTARATPLQCNGKKFKTEKVDIDLID